MERTCRICYGDYGEISNELISPCKCKGSTKWVHRECLNTWVTKKNRYIRMQCEICMHPYDTSTVFDRVVIWIYTHSSVLTMFAAIITMSIVVQFVGDFEMVVVFILRRIIIFEIVEKYSPYRNSDQLFHRFLDTLVGNVLDRIMVLLELPTVTIFVTMNLCKHGLL